MTQQNMMESAARAHMQQLEQDLRRANAHSAHWEREAMIYEKDLHSCIKFAAAGWLAAMALVLYLLAR